MSKKGEYRSSLRSRDNIRRAFIELIQQKGTNEIKITDLVERADINRSTFYAHYQGIHAVREELENEIIQKLFEYMDSNPHIELLKDPSPFFNKIGNELEKNRDIYRMLLETSGPDSFAQKLKYIFLERLSSDKNVFCQIKHKKDFLICMNFFAGGVFNLFFDWAAGRIDMPMDELLKIICITVTDSLKKYI